MQKYLFLLLLFAAKLTAQPTLESLLSAPFYDQLNLSPQGNALVWVKNERGVRNIQYAAAPDWTPRQLSDNTADDGVEISQIVWHPDGKSLFYVRGNAPALRATQPHNPAHLPEGTAPAVWVQDIAGGAARKIGAGMAPTVSPDGKYLTYISGGQIWIRALDDALPARQLCQVRSGAGQLSWSPDSKRLAFVSNRGETAHIGVYDMDKADYQFMEPGIDRDQYPVWSPDGRSLAFMRIPRPNEFISYFIPRRSGPPWSICVADVAQGTVRTIFSADPGSGSVYWPHTGRQQLLWAADNRLYFCWEKTGWQQLYSIPAAGGARPVQVTNGAFEVDELQLTNDRKTVYFNSNQQDIDRKHIWQLQNGKVVALSNGQSIESNISMSDAGTLFFVQTDGRRPARVCLREAGKWKELTPLPSGFPVDALVEPEHLEWKAADGQTFYNQVFYPKNMRKDHSHPALIFVHGGSRRQMLLGYHPSLYYVNAYHLSHYFAARGYVVVNINYRSGIGYGRDFREAEQFGVMGASEFGDLEALGEWLKAQPAVSPGKIYVWGGSYGGYMTAHALARRSDLFAAGADMHGVHNWNTLLPTFTPEYDSLRYEDIAKSAWKSSPLAFIGGWTSPVLLIHGDDDANVPFQETVVLQRHLRQKGVPTELLVIPDEVHSFLRYASWWKAYSAIAAFFEKQEKRE